MVSQGLSSGYGLLFEGFWVRTCGRLLSAKDHESEAVFNRNQHEEFSA